MTLVHLWGSNSQVMTGKINQLDPSFNNRRSTVSIYVWYILNATYTRFSVSINTVIYTTVRLSWHGGVLEFLWASCKYRIDNIWILKCLPLSLSDVWCLTEEVMSTLRHLKNMYVSLVSQFIHSFIYFSICLFSFRKSILFFFLPYFFFFWHWLTISFLCFCIG